MKGHKVPATLNCSPYRNFNLDKGMGKLAQVAELVQFMDLGRVEPAKLANGGNLSTSKDRHALCNLSDKTR